MLEYLLSQCQALTMPSFLVPQSAEGHIHHRLRLGTEYNRGGTIFRAHDNYRQLGPWYDWVMLRWEREDNYNYAQPVECQARYGDNKTIAANHLYAPGQVLGFVEAADGRGVSMVASTCDFSHSQGSVSSTQ